MLEAKVLTVSVDRDWRDLYEAFWRPEEFPKWASGLADAGLKRDGDTWSAEGPAGRVRIRFSDHNTFGIMDHWVDTDGGQVVYVPLRIVANGTGAEVMMTLFRQPDMDDVRYAEDARWVRRDLDALKRLAEGGAVRSPQ